MATPRSTSLRRRRWGQKQYGEVTKVAIWYTILLEKLVNIAVFTQAMLCHSIWNMARHKYSSMSFFTFINEAFYHMESSIKNYRDKPKRLWRRATSARKKNESVFCGSLEKLQCERGCFSDLHLSRSRRQGFITFVQSTTLHNCKL